MAEEPDVVIVQRRMTHYRIPLFERMRAMLKESGINLRVLHGDPTESEMSKRDEGRLDWAERVPTRYFLNGRICWQNFHEVTKTSSLVIVTQENKLLFNSIALVLFRPKRYAFWGHGGNLQSARPDGWAEKFKSWTTRKVDWWFAYTDLSRKLVTSQGFSERRVTVVDNAIDTTRLRTEIDAVTHDDVQKEKIALGIPAESRVGLFLGSLYAEKRLDFLLEACRQVAARVPGFFLIVAGDGPDRRLVEAARSDCPWLRYVGVSHGRHKAVLLAMVDVVLNPGLVGLGILDSFVAQAPMITTSCGVHSPEIVYLANGENGIITQNDQGAYANEVVRVLSEPDAMAGLRAGCAESAKRYTIENMAARFVHGIRQVLAA